MASMHWGSMYLCFLGVGLRLPCSSPCFLSVFLAFLFFRRFLWLYFKNFLSLFYLNLSIIKIINFIEAFKKIFQNTTKKKKKINPQHIQCMRFNKCLCVNDWGEGEGWRWSCLCEVMRVLLVLVCLDVVMRVFDFVFSGFFLSIIVWCPFF
jgi:hypothetical protein